MKKLRLKKSVWITGIVLAVIIILFLLFLIFGGVFLKLNVENSDKVIEIEYNSDNFEYSKATCSFMGQDISKNIKRTSDVDLSKLGKQEIKYTCSKWNFEKEKNVTYNVIDNVAPVVTLNGDEELSLYQNTEYQEQGCIVVDNYDGDISDKVTIEGSVDTTKIGTYELNYVVKDSSGNESQKKRKVTVKENTLIKNCGVPGTIYLTFDDGPNNVYTPVILDVLKKYNVKATFFITGNGSDALVKREYDEGHAIGIHTQTHDYKTVYSSKEAYWNDMNKVQARIKKITGKETNLIRFPGGASNTVSRKYNKGIMGVLTKDVIQKGYQYFDWNISSGDAGGTTDPKVEYKNVVNYLSKKRGNVILMHDIKKHTSLAIEDIIKYGIENGYKFDVLNKNIECHQRVNN